MKSTLLILGLLISFKVSSQETKFINKSNGGYNEEYYVLKKDKKTKDGTYVKYRQSFGNIIVIESGSYTNGIKGGLWQIFYDSYDRRSWNAIKEKGAYKDGEKDGVWYYYYLDTVATSTNATEFSNGKKTDSVGIEINQSTYRVRTSGTYSQGIKKGIWSTWDFSQQIIYQYDFTENKLIFSSTTEEDDIKNRDPIFLGSRRYLSEFLSKNLSMIDLFQKINLDSIGATIKFSIDTNGKTKGFDISSNWDNNKFKSELERVIRLTDLNWIPGTLDGQVAEKQYEVSFNMINLNKTTTGGRFKTYFLIGQRTTANSPLLLRR